MASLTKSLVIQVTRTEKMLSQSMLELLDEKQRVVTAGGE